MELVSLASGGPGQGGEKLHPQFIGAPCTSSGRLRCAVWFDEDMVCSQCDWVAMKN